MTLFAPQRRTHRARGVAESPTAWTPVSTRRLHLFTWMTAAGAGSWTWTSCGRTSRWCWASSCTSRTPSTCTSSTSALNVYFASTQARAARSSRCGSTWRRSRPASSRWAPRPCRDLTRKEMLDLYACTECGRCQSVCPAWNTGKPLSPKLLIMNLRDHAPRRGRPRSWRRRRRARLEPAGARAPRSSTTRSSGPARPAARACRSARWTSSTSTRSSTCAGTWCMGESRFPPEAGAMLAEPRDAGRTPGASRPVAARRLGRGTWRAGARGRRRPAEYLYWVGCAGSFDDRAKKISRARGRAPAARPGVSFAILGPRELCTGDPARRMGNEYLYQTLAKQNVETLNAIGRARRSSPTARTASTRSRTSTRDYGGDVRGHPPHAAARRAGGGGPPHARPQEVDDARSPTTTPATWAGTTRSTTRPATCSTSVPGRRAVEMPRHHERGLLLRRGRRPDVDGGADRQAHQRRAHGRGGGHGRRHGRRGVPVLPDHARRRRQGPGRHDRSPRHSPGGRRSLAPPDHRAGSTLGRTVRTLLDPGISRPTDASNTWWPALGDRKGTRTNDRRDEPEMSVPALPVRTVRASRRRRCRRRGPPGSKSAPAGRCASTTG